MSQRRCHFVAIDGFPGGTIVVLDVRTTLRQRHARQAISMTFIYTLHKDHKNVNDVYDYLNI